MKRTLPSIALILLALVAPGRVEPTDGRVTVVLTPLFANSQPLEEDTLQIASRDYKATQWACIAFLLPAAIPEEAVIHEARLSVVGTHRAASRRQDVQIYRAYNTYDDNAQTVTCDPPELEAADRIGGWTADASGEVVASTGPKLLEAVKKAYEDRRGILLLRLQSEDREATWRYGSSKCPEVSEDCSRQKPRLVVTYSLKQPLPSVDAERTARTFHTPPPAGFHKAELVKCREIKSGPLVYGESVLMLAKACSYSSVSLAPTPCEGPAKDYQLYSFSPAGAPEWCSNLGYTPGAHSVVDPRGLLLNFGTGRLGIHDLENKGTDLGLESTLVLQAPPTLSPGGNLFYTGSGAAAYAYARSPAGRSGRPAEELWRSKDQLGVSKTRIVVGHPDAEGRYRAYALGQDGLRVFEAITGAPDGSAFKFAQDVYNNFDPVAAPGERGDFVVLAASGANEGVLTARLDHQPAWVESLSEKQGRLDAQPTVLLGETPAIVAIQKGKLVRWKLADGEELCSSPEAGLAATSNFVADGQGSVYFLNGGAIYGYAKEDAAKSCQQIATLGTPPGDKPSIPAPPAPDKRLAFAAGGSLLARSGNAIVAYHRLSTAPLTLRPSDLEDGTVYSATTIRLESGPAPAAGATTRTVWLKARDGISFGRGFRWPANTVLRAQVFGRP